MNPIKLIPQRNKRANRGQSIVEFCMTAGIFLLFSLGAIEFTCLFVEKQRVGALSRECANISFRECYDSETSVDAQACLDDLQRNLPIYNGAKNILKDFNTKGKMIVSFYSDTKLNGKASDVFAKFERGSGAYSSVFSKNSLFTTGHLKKQVICVGEVFYHHDPVTPIGAILNMVLPEHTYEATVY